MVRFEPTTLEPVEGSTLLPVRAVAEGSPCLRDMRLVVPHLRFTPSSEGPSPEPSVALTCESTQLLRCLQKVEDEGQCDRRSLVFLQSAGEMERENFRPSLPGRCGASLRRCYRRRRRRKNASAVASWISPISQKGTRASGVGIGMIMGRSSTLMAISAGTTARRAIASPRTKSVIVGTTIAI